MLLIIIIGGNQREKAREKSQKLAAANSKSVSKLSASQLAVKREQDAKIVAEKAAVSDFFLRIELGGQRVDASPVFGIGLIGKGGSGSRRGERRFQISATGTRFARITMALV